jgi:Divergent InlB B-repeat domain
VSYTVAASASPAASGTVTGAGTFASGSSQTVTATPNSGYTFANWTANGSIVSTSASYTFTFNGNRNLVANFTVKPVNYTIALSDAPSTGGTMSGSGTFTAGTTRTVTAKANSGYTFANWTENGTVASTAANYTFMLAANRNLVANFHKHHR